MSRKYPAPTLSSRELMLTWQSAALLLDYPDEALLARIPLLRETASELPAAIAASLDQMLSELEQTPLTQLQEDYVETFDTRRRCNLFLTYFAHGDTRKRGMALLRFKQTYLRSGFILNESELPDHLCVVLEYAATIDQGLGRELILDHRAGLELLRLSLRDMSSRWFAVVDAVCATLPPLRGEERDAVRRLAAEGPPEEEVGLAPFATPEFSPGAPTETDRTLLPMPTFPGAR